MESVALTDHGNVYGMIEFYKECRKAGIKPILGVEAYIAPGDHKDKSNGDNDEGRYRHLILLAENNTGWKNIIQLVTASYMDGFYYKPRMSKALLRQYSEGIIALSGCLGGEVSQLVLGNRFDEAVGVVNEYKEIFGKDNFYIEIQRHGKIPETVAIYNKMIELSKVTNTKMVVTSDSHYLESEDKETHDILLAIQTGKSVNHPKKFTLVDDFSVKSAEAMSEKYKDISEAVSNTVLVANRCNVEIEIGRVLLPKFETPNNEKSEDYLRKLVEENISKRYKVVTDDVKDRIEFELGVIEKMGYPDYFLIVQDFINWAKERGIVVGPGRGSAAGSIVSYIIGITDLDPIRYELLFERFLNPDRNEMPDIDVDITDTRRDEVFAYLEQKYGQKHVAHIITFGTMAARAAIRDVGRALDIEYSFCDSLAKLIPFGFNLTKALESVDELKNLYKTDERAKRILDSAQRLEGVARHASVHACGTVISAEPLTNLVPLQFSPQKDDVVVTQFEMHAIEDLGLLKMDLLGLKNLTIIENTLRIIKERTSEVLDISKIPLDDAKTFKLLQLADTTGVFQLESGGMRRYLKELKPTELEDIIVMVSLYRPGPMDLIPSYIRRKHGKEESTYLHPKLKPILEKTYGIGVYQEQMMRIARDLAGYSLAEADKLRKAIGKKIKKLLDEQQEKLVSGMIGNGISEKTAKAIWELFPPFARYGFNRSHAACYAVIAYQTAWLKASYPVAFMTALFNSDSGDVERMSFLIGECKKMGIQVLPPDVNKSSASFETEQDNIRFGLEGIKNVGHNIVQAIIDERNAGGEFLSFNDLITRVTHKDLNKKSLESLIKSGTFDCFDIERNTLLTNLEDIISYIREVRKESSSSQAGLFGEGFTFNQGSTALELEPAPPADAKDKLAWEKELLGLYVSEHPLQLAAAKIALAQPTPIKDILAEKSNVRMYRLAGMISSVKSIITKTGKPMAFVKIEDTTGTMELVIFSDLFTAYQSLFVEGKIMVVVGKLSFRNGSTSLIADKVKEL